MNGLNPEDELIRQYFDPERQQRLDEARSKSQDNLLTANLADAASQIGASIAGATNYDPKGFDQLKQTASMPEQQLLADYKVKDDQSKLIADYFGKSKQREFEAQKLAQQREMDERKFGLQEKTAQQRHDQIMAEIKAKGEGGYQMNPVEIAYNKEIGKDLAEKRKMKPRTQASLAALGSIYQELGKSDNISGSLVGNTPDWILRGTGQNNAVEMRQAVERIIQEDLKPTLGAQFTEKEAAKLIERSYDPRAPEEENRRKLARLIKTTQWILDQQNKMDEYFAANRGNMMGYQDPFEKITDVDALGRMVGIDFYDGGSVGPTGLDPLGEKTAFASEGGPKPGSIIKSKGKRYQVINEKGDIKEL